MGSVVYVGVLALSINQIVDASNQPLVFAMPIAFVISESRPKFNIVLAKSMVCCHVVLEVGMLFDLSIIPGKLEFPVRSNLLAQKAKEPIVMESDQVIVLHLQTYEVFEFLDTMVRIRNLVMVLDNFENLASFQITRIRLAGGILSFLVIQSDRTDLPPDTVSRRYDCHQRITQSSVDNPEWFCLVVIFPGPFFIFDLVDPF